MCGWQQMKQRERRNVVSKKCGALVNQVNLLMPIDLRLKEYKHTQVYLDAGRILILLFAE